MIRADAVNYEIGSFALDASIEMNGSEYFVLLGATGSGKTIFLECLCGLREIAAGKIEIDGRDVTGSEPADRNIGYVPQDGALFDHLDVRDNIAFGPKVHGMSPGRRAGQVADIAQMLGIGHLLGRRIRGLSGGERQRVALARALACSPAVLLLDEPVSALDEFTRDRICRQLVRLQRETGVSVVHVCHSFEEARLVADRIGIIGNGRIVQTGTADELMTRPASRYVANILRLENVFTGRATPAAGGSQIELDGVSLDGPKAEGDIEFFIRPWDIRLAGTGDAAGANSAEGKVVEFSLAGPTARLRIDGPLPLLLVLPRQAAAADGFAEGMKIRVLFGPSAVHVLRPE
ncbi:MAG: ABC transporter ATP-binding protein [Planctomycetota bacterium]